jgi:acyltransferase
MNSEMKITDNQKSRINWVDSVKFIGIFLVFYGHYIEEVYFITGTDSIAYKLFKVIYSFHIPLFFIISGFFWFKKEPRIQFIKKIILKRLLPVLSFSLLSMPFWIIFIYLKNGSFDSLFFLQTAQNFLKGIPSLNFPLWFLVCLFSAEILAYFSNLYFLSNSKSFYFGFGLLMLGYYIIEITSLFHEYIPIKLNFWFMNEAIIAIGFCLIGKSFYGFIINSSQSKTIFIYLLLILFSSMMFIFNFINSNEVVIMSISKHGKLVPFITNALLGSSIIFCIGSVFPNSKIVTYLGSNTLILLGINGFFFHFINVHIARFSLDICQSSWYILLNSTIVTITSILICYPFVWIINKFVPQLFGNPFAQGPYFNSYKIK